MVTISELWVYPIKSCAGVRLEEAKVTDRGLALDRTWMVVDDGGRFLSQRSHPALALVQVAVSADHLKIRAPGLPELTVPAGHESGAPRTVTVWRDACAATSAGRDAALWFSEHLGVSCELVRTSPATDRPVDPAYARPTDQVAFADGFPFLLLSQASLDELNRRLDTPLPMNRFRPNLVVSGCPAHAEDGWARLEVAPVTFHVVKPCARCVITTVDQVSGERGAEPLRTLVTYRRNGDAIIFGQNLVHDGSGVVRVGDEVRVRG